MASKSYRARVVVLKKTKLREKDLIVTMLDENGMLRQAVAKGARRPGGSFAARLELFSVVDGWFVEGRSLDVVTDAKFAEGYSTHQFGLEQAACASAVAELVSAVAQEGLAHERLFDMTTLALTTMASSSSDVAIAICVADLLKTLAMVGFRPSFDTCVFCGRQIDWEAASSRMRLSVSDGGIVCDQCEGVPDAVVIDTNTVAWARAIISRTFAEIADNPPDVSTSFSLLQFVRQWAQAHVGKNLKSVDYLLACGLF